MKSFTSIAILSLIPLLVSSAPLEERATTTGRTTTTATRSTTRSTTTNTRSSSSTSLRPTATSILSTTGRSGTSSSKSRTSTRTSSSGTVSGTSTKGSTTGSSRPSASVVPSKKVVQQDASWALARLGQKGPLKTLGTEKSVPAKGTFLQDAMAAGLLDDDYTYPSKVDKQVWSFTYDEAWGSDVYAYVLDTGVRGTHSDLAGKVEEGYAVQSVGGKGNVDPTLGHGTAVASIIAGKKYGIAKASAIVPVRISKTGDESTTPVSDISEGIKWAIKDFAARKAANNKASAVINLSWIVRPELEVDLAAAMKNGIHVVMTAGNDYEDDCANRVKNIGQFIVGGIDWDDQFHMNYGKCINVIAPALRINAAGIKSDNEMVAHDGTSFAAPLVSGIIAAIASEKGPITPEQMMTVVQGTYTSNPAGIKGLDDTVDVLLQSLLPNAQEQ